jgi:hypothetical protein
MSHFLDAFAAGARPDGFDDADLAALRQAAVDLLPGEAAVRLAGEAFSDAFPAPDGTGAGLDLEFGAGAPSVSPIEPLGLPAEAAGWTEPQDDGPADGLADDLAGGTAAAGSGDTAETGEAWLESPQDDLPGLPGSPELTDPPGTEPPGEHPFDY